MIDQTRETRLFQLISLSQKSVLSWLGICLSCFIGLNNFLKNNSNIFLFECLVIIILFSIDRIIGIMSDIIKWRNELFEILQEKPSSMKNSSAKFIDGIILFLHHNRKQKIFIYKCY